jgi:hypothetical protein
MRQPTTATPAESKEKVKAHDQRRNERVVTSVVQVTHQGEPWFECVQHMSQRGKPHCEQKTKAGVA